MNFFEKFGIRPVRLNLSAQELEEKFYALSLQSHPDRNLGDFDAHTSSADLNSAYRTLKDKWLRAEYFIGLEGLKSGSQVPPRLAELYFELQDSEDSQSLKTLRDRLKSELAIRDQEVQSLFEAYDLGEDRAKILGSLRLLVDEHKYGASMLKDLESKVK